MSYSISQLREVQKPQDSIFSKLITRKLSLRLTWVLLKLLPNISPNTVSLLSFVLAVLAAVCFLHPSYAVRVLGVVLFQLGFVFDCSDGEVARATGRMSPFGAFLDSTLDRFKEILILGVLTLYLASSSPSPMGWTSISILIVGVGAILGLQMVAYLREAKKATFPTTRTSEIFISKSMYLGTVDIFVYLVSLAVLIHMEFWLLVAIAVVSIPLVLKQIWSAKRQSA